MDLHKFQPDWILQNKPFRFLISYIERNLNWRDKENIDDYLSTKNQKKIITLICRQPYEFEHIRDIFFIAKEHPNFFPLPISIRDKGEDSRKVYRKFEDKYNLKYNENFFPYYWLPTIKTDVLIETSITTYSDISHSKNRILYVHGLSSLGFSKNHAHIRHVHKYNYLFVTGPLQKKSLILAQKRYGGQLPELVDIGFLRGDRLLENKKSFNNSQFLNDIGLDHNFTVLYTPTWGSFSSVEDWLDCIIEISQLLEINLIIKLHPFMMNSKRNTANEEIYWTDELEKIDQEYENIHIIFDDNIDDYLLCADVLLTDASSLGIEFMILEKPVIFLPCPEYFKIYGNEKPIAWVREGKEVANSQELRNYLQKVMDDALSNSITIDDIIYNPGRSLEYITHFLDNIR